MKIKLIKFENFVEPKRAHYNDAGADVYSPNDYHFDPHTTIAIPLGFGIEIPDGMCGMIVPRSGHAKRGIIANIPPIDSGYRGEVHAIITNHSQFPYRIEKGERIGQLLILPIIIPEFVTELGDERGVGAFNSTGR